MSVLRNLLLELVILLFIVLFGKLIAIALGRSEKKDLPFRIIAVLMLVMEAAKQIYMLSVGYDLYYLPLQICSIFLISYPLAAFGRGKIKSFGWCLSLCLGFSASFAQVFLSFILTKDYVFKLFTPEATPFHYFTVFYHHIVILHFVLMLFLKPYIPDKRDILPTIAFYAGFMVLSCVCANIFHENYSGFINYGAEVFDYFKKYGQLTFNVVGFVLNNLEYLFGVLVCFRFPRRQHLLF